MIKVESAKDLQNLQSQSIENLIKLMLDRDEKYAEDMKAMMKILNTSLEKLSEINEEDDDDEMEKSLMSLQKDMANSIKQLTDISKKNNVNDIVAQITKAIDNKEIVNSLNILNQKIEEQMNDRREWSFHINRDHVGKMVSVTAKQI